MEDYVAGDGPGGAWPTRPKTPRALHKLLKDHLDLDVPTTPLIVGHASPFDYVRHAFFEDAPGPRDCVVWANRGGGKTFLAAVATLLDLLYKPEIEIRLLGGSLDQSKRMHAHLRGLLSRPELAELVAGKITDRRVSLINGSSAELLAQSQTSVRGTRVQKLRCDEVELFDPEVWEAAQLTTRGKACGDVQVRGSIECLSTMHVPFGIMDRLVRESTANNSRAIFKWGVIDVIGACGPEHVCEPRDDEPCPLLPECGGIAKLGKGKTMGHVPIAEAISLKSRVSLGTWESEMLCTRPSRSACVYPEFSEADHTGSFEAKPGATWIGGMDFGIRSPTVVLFAMLEPDSVVTVMDERIERDVPLREHAEAILGSDWPALEWLGVDPAGRQRSLQTGESDSAALRKAGLVIRDRPFPFHKGIELVRARLRPAAGRPTLRIHERCQGLIEAITRYHYPLDDERSLQPEKDGSDHAADALRYMIQNLDRPFRTTRSKY